MATHGSVPEYSPEFLTAWHAYPPRPNHNKQLAYKAWCARIKEGCDPAAMIAGTHRYANYIRSVGRWGTEYVKMAATFWGPCHHFENTYDSETILTLAAQELLAYYSAEQLV